MEKREKIKQVYNKYGVRINNESIEQILANKERTEDFMRLYKAEEIDSMNEIFGKEYGNKYFTQEELKAAEVIDLFDKYEIGVASIIWRHRENENMTKLLDKMLEDNDIKDFNELINSLMKEEVNV